MSLPIEWEQRGCAVPTYWHNITSTTEKLVISWTLNLNQKKVTGWNKNEMEQIRASYVEEPVWPGSQLCTEGTAAAEAVKAWNDASSLWRQWHFFQQQRLVACPWVIFQEPGRQPRCNTQLMALCTCRELRALQEPEDILNSASPFPLRYLLESWAQGWKLHPKRGECRIVHSHISQLKARLQAWVTESSWSKSTNYTTTILVARKNGSFRQGFSERLSHHNVQKEPPSSLNSFSENILSAAGSSPGPTLV